MNRQNGIHTVEFAIVGAVFFVLLFGVIEFGRALFTWNTLTEATRRGARLAVVCPENHASIKNVAVFNSPDASGASPILPNLDSENVTIEYPAGFVRVRIAGYQYSLLIPPLIPGLDFSPFIAPEFETTLPRESMGAVPDSGAGSIQCP